MLAIVLALGTSVAYGTANFLGPLLGRTHPIGAVLLIGQLAALVVAVLIVLASGDAPPDAAAIGFGLLAGAGNALGLAAFLRATQLGPVAVAAAIGALGTIVPVLVGIVDGETVTATQALGIALAITGAALAAQKSREGIAATPAGIAWALASALGIGVLLSALPTAVESGTAWALLDARLAVVVLVGAGIVVLRAPTGAPRAAIPSLAAPGLILLAGTVAYAEASTRGALSVVSVLASLATVVTVGLAFAILGERLGRIQQVGVAVAIVGTVLLAV